MVRALPARASDPRLAVRGGHPRLRHRLQGRPAAPTPSWTELGNPFTAIGTDSGRIAPDWGLYGVPETFVVAGDGTVVDRLPFR
jgi:cytochrome c biogenesis protein CcmG/thiol:disulfide interchange protein DsbE